MKNPKCRNLPFQAETISAEPFLNPTLISSSSLFPISLPHHTRTIRSSLAPPSLSLITPAPQHQKLLPHRRILAAPRHRRIVAAPHHRRISTQASLSLTSSLLHFTAPRHRSLSPSVIRDRSPDIYLHIRVSLVTDRSPTQVPCHRSPSPLPQIDLSLASIYPSLCPSSQMAKESAVWNDVLVDVFCDICIKEVDNNNRPHTHFNPVGWKNIKDMQGYSFQKQVKIVIATMTLHNYIRRHADRDRHFVRSEEREGYGSSGGIEMDDDVEEEEYHGHGAQEMETIRNNITQSLMSARNNGNI
ncbi:putative Myb/SANT-like domain-containing protein [Rosa chinensis]|uniref:Putative Myb/SANT-like domain-containing protein n=1 Tax=Rosa chinensis TaxID=74649 RepID=A0A2P6Q4D7_ROSCH|nr:uncharacterized protein LOC112164659 [Rosa chinensis]PRQ29045.1 putative Myb/SANT-like domain-containing protein [Rosa chinensis]